MTKSIKINFIFNLINTTTQLLFPLITFPYVSRIMFAEGVGQVNFYQSIIHYISLLTSLGIPVYAVRKIAMIRDDIQLMNKTVIEILFLHIILTIIGYIAVIIIGNTIPQVQIGKNLFYIISLSLIFTVVGCEWFYQATENFKYITTRGLIIKLLSIAFLFVFVKDKQDILWYGLYTVIGSIGGNLFNLIHLRHYIHKHYIIWKELCPFSHLLPALKVAALVLLSAIYISLNTVILGFLADNASVGYYTAAQKIYVITYSLTNSLTLIMIPRISNLIKKKEYSEIKRLTQKTYYMSLLLTLPISTGIFFIAPYIIPIFCGETFTPASQTLQIMSPMIFIVGICSIIGIQTLYPMGYLSYMIKATLIGCIVDLISCFIFIPIIAYNGAALSYFIAEVSVLISLGYMGRKILPIKYLNKSLIPIFISAIVLGIILYIIDLYNWNNFTKSFMMVLIGGFSYFIALFLLKEPETRNLIYNLKQKIVSFQNKKS